MSIKVFNKAGIIMQSFSSVKEIKMSFDPVRWGKIVGDSGLWYANNEIWPTIERLFVNPPDVMSQEDQGERDKILRFFAKSLLEGTVRLGRRAEYFDDGDRWTTKKGWVTPIDTVVIHHTATNPHMTYDLLNAFGLLRLYCPVYMQNPAFKKNGKSQSISSGHLYAGRPTFVEFHHIVYNAGMLAGASLPLLDDRYLGFHADNYQVNCRSIGIAVVGDLSDTTPGQRTIDEINKIIARYRSVTQIIGHKEVDGVVTNCPGNTWDQWKHSLVLPSI